VAVPLAGGRLARPLGIIHRRQPKLSATALRFLELLRQGEEAPTPSRPELGLFAGGTGLPSRANDNHRGRNGTTRTPKRMV
jgi:hypothetical protein